MQPVKMHQVFQESLNFRVSGVLFYSITILKRIRGNIAICASSSYTTAY
ncbi:hypothetical protein ABID22_002944 [Pontibacter aydingkolensis]